MMNSGAPTKIQQFGKEELNLILKFGAQDLFKVCQLNLFVYVLS